MWEIVIVVLALLGLSMLLLPLMAMGKVSEQQRRLAELEAQIHVLQTQVDGLLAQKSALAAAVPAVATASPAKQVESHTASQPSPLASYQFVPVPVSAMQTTFSPFISPFVPLSIPRLDTSLTDVTPTDLAVAVAEPHDETALEATISKTTPAMTQATNIAKEQTKDESSITIVTSLASSLKQWFFGENFIVRIGAIVLLVGVVLLIKLASQYIHVPIAVRMALIAVAGLVVTGVGYRTTGKRRGYGLTLQGVGFAMIYLTVFSSFRLYQLLPSGLTFGLLAVLAGLTVAFSVWQNALPLAVLAFGGAFLAPILVSQPDGSAVMLFGYYLLLNVAVAWIAHFRTWKLLNALSLAVTFGLAYVWGFNQYRMVNSQWLTMRWQLLGLLMAHMGLYLFIAIRYSQQVIAYNQRHTTLSDSQKPLVAMDAGLLFGTALLGFGLFASLLNDKPLLLALTSAGLSAVYLGVGFGLLKQYQSASDSNLTTREVLSHFYNSYQLLIEATLALGVGFLALVIPLALSATWLTIGWAVQGGALVWLGVRSQRPWTVWFGLALQAVTAWLLCDFVAVQQGWYGLLDRIGIAHASPLTDFDNTLPVVVLTAAVLLSAFVLRHCAGQDSTPLADNNQSQVDRQNPISHYPLAYPMAIVASVLVAISVHHVMTAVTDNEPWLILGWAIAGSLAVLVAQWSHERYGWRALRQVSRFALPMVMLLWLWVWFKWFAITARYAPEPSYAYLGLEGVTQGLIGLMAVTAIAELLGGWLLSRWYREGITVAVDEVVWLFSLLVIATVAFISIPIQGSELSAIVVILPTLLSVLGLMALVYIGGLRHPLWAWLNPARLLTNSQWLLVIVTFVWLLRANIDFTGQLFGFYLPMLNPLDITLVSILLYHGYLYVTHRQPWLAVLIGMGAFLTLSSMLVRTFGYWLQTPTWQDGAWQIAEIQTGLTILWSIMATFAMFFASKKGHRAVWFIGVSLLSLVVLKLVLVDMSNTGAILRVVSFIGAGLLMLIIGYLAPLPPTKADKNN